ncbi:hypothetical protein, partial [Oryzihumus sp.]
MSQPHRVADRRRLSEELLRLADAIEGDRSAPEATAMVDELGLGQGNEQRDEIAARATWVLRALSLRFADAVEHGRASEQLREAALPQHGCGLWLVIGWAAGVAAATHDPEGPATTDEEAHQVFGDQFLDLL